MLVGPDYYAVHPGMWTLDIPGFCCPMGSLCYYDNNSKGIKRINAYGNTTNATPSSNMFDTSTQTSSPEDDNKIRFSPESTWKTSENYCNCGVSETIYTTEVVNASISFNYIAYCYEMVTNSGPGITVHTVISRIGVYAGPSQFAPNGTNSSVAIQFDAFSIPEVGSQIGTASWAQNIKASRFLGIFG
ncbi:hypothetical protein BDQ17DRAFT_1332992 [Cyathus striatus]|nr:hypothetical protein BDQ17DRAFT_1332992 [Cyathus striatus]